MIRSDMVCPGCGRKEKHESNKKVEVYIDGFEDKNYFMECKCKGCLTRFLVDIDSMEE